MVRMRCGMGVSGALTLWKWRITFVVEWTLLLENRMVSLFRVCVACLIVTSCDVESIDEFVCEMKWSADSALFSWSPPITRVWERDHANLLFLGFLISFHSTSLLYHLHRLAFEFHNCNHHHSLSFSSNCNPYSIHLLITINSTHSNSSQWSLFNRITLFRHLFPFYSPCNDPFWWITPHQNQSFNSWVKNSSSTLYFYHSSTHTIKSYPLEVAHVIAHWFITYLAMGKPQIIPNYWYSSKQILITYDHITQWGYGEEVFVVLDMVDRLHDMR